MEKILVAWWVIAELLALSFGLGWCARRLFEEARNGLRDARREGLEKEYREYVALNVRPTAGMNVLGNCFDPTFPLTPEQAAEMRDRGSECGMAKPPPESSEVT